MGGSNPRSRSAASRFSREVKELGSVGERGRVTRGDRGGREECFTSAGVWVGCGGEDLGCEDEGVAGTVMCNREVTRRINDGFMLDGGFVIGGDDLCILVFDLRRGTSFSVAPTGLSRK
jgi:hypothetical protein